MKTIFLLQLYKRGKPIINVEVRKFTYSISCPDIKASSIIEGAKIWFFINGVANERSVRVKVLLNWFQVLIEWITTGLMVKAEIGCLKGNLEHNKAAGEVEPMDSLSNTVHSVLLTSVQ